MPAGDHEITVSAPGKATKVTTITVASDATFFFVTLDPAYAVEIGVNDGLFDLTNSTVEIDGYSGTYDAGLKVWQFELPAGDHEITVSAPGKATKVTTITVASDATFFFVTLDPAYAVEIGVNDGLFDLTNSTVEIDGYSGTYDAGLKVWQFELPAGDHEITVSAPGKATKVTTITVASDATFFFVTLDPAYAVEIGVNDGLFDLTNATVEIDGYTGTYDAGLKVWQFELPAGDHEITVSAPGKATKVTTITVASDATFFFVTLDPAYAVEIGVNDGLFDLTNATVEIDGYTGTFDAGLKVWQFELPAGDHEITVSAPGKATKVTTITVASDATFFFVTLDPAYAVEIGVNDGLFDLTNATVEIDGYTGTYDAGLKVWQFELPAGDHEITVSAPGKATKVTTITVASDATFFFVTLDPAYAVEIGVNDGLFDLTNSTVEIDGYTGTYDAGLKVWQFELPVGDHEITVSAPGKATKVITITVAADATFFFVTLENAYSVSFIATVSGDPSGVAGADVTIGEETVSTDATGEAVFEGLAAGTYQYSASLTGYPDVTGEVVIESSDVTENIVFTAGQTVTLTVNDGANVLEGASIEIDGQTLSTNDQGQAQVSLTDGNYDYTVSLDGYLGISGSVTVAGAAVSETISLTKISSVTLTVTDGTDPVEGATVIFNSLESTSSSDGTVTYEEVVDGTYDYSVAMAGYVAATGTITVSGADVAEAVTLTAVYQVSLTIVDGGGSPVAGASVTFDGVSATSDADGMASFSEVVDGTYNYSVEHADYIGQTGSVTVAGSDVSEEVTLQLVLSLEEQFGASVAFYPNPATDQLTIEVGVEDSFTVSILDMSGAEVLRQDYAPQNSIQLSVKDLENGVYVLRIHAGNALSTHRIIKQ